MRWIWIAAATAAGGCELNEAPTVVEADVDCSYDSDLFDYVWTASAAIDDANGEGDVFEVQAFLYDTTFGTRELEGTLELFDAGGGAWETERLEGGTGLWCAGGTYEVELVATDRFGAEGRRTFVIRRE